MKSRLLALAVEVDISVVLVTGLSGNKVVVLPADTNVVNCCNVDVFGFTVVALSFNIVVGATNIVAVLDITGAFVVVVAADDFLGTNVDVDKLYAPGFETVAVPEFITALEIVVDVLGIGVDASYVSGFVGVEVSNDAGAPVVVVGKKFISLGTTVEAAYVLLVETAVEVSDGAAASESFVIAVVDLYGTDVDINGT